MKRKLFAIALLVALLAFSLSALPVVSANSAQMYWEGITSTGALIVGEDCPVVVKSEKLVFDVPHFPEIDYKYSAKQKLADYDAKVSATYELENPADYDVKVRLAFPFGIVPDYFNVTDELVEKYSVTVDGEAVAKKVRYTYSGGNWNGSFVTAEAVARLRDEKAENGWVNGDAHVLTVRYVADGAGYDRFDAIFTVNGREDVCFILDYNYYKKSKDRIETGVLVNDGKTFDFSIVYAGEAPDVEFRAENDGKEVGSTLEQISENVCTLAEFAAENNPFSGNDAVTETDWHNVVVDYVASGNGVVGNVLSRDTERFVSNNVMCWYEYELSLPAGTAVTNTVTAPLIPDTNENYEPPVYIYDYLLSPAKDWAEFGTLEIEINTPYVLLDAEKNGYVRTEAGYRKSYDSLPDGELTFRLSESGNPERKPNGYFAMTMLFILMGAVPLLGVAGIAAVITVASVGAARRNAKESDAEKRKKNTVVAAKIGFVSSLAYALVLLLPLISLFAGLSNAAALITLTVACALIAAAVLYFAITLLREKKQEKDISASREQ